MKREIIYPIFLECSELSCDTFWKNIFEDLAYGQTPYGTYISKGFFCCSYKNKEFSYKIEKNDVQELFSDIQELCKRVGILSYEDKIQKKIDFKNAESDMKGIRMKWCSIRKKNLKDFLIENYVIRMKKEYNLDYKQAKYLNYVIFIAMIFKIITIKDIEYEEGEIKNIQGISFAPKKIILDKDIYSYDGRKCLLVEDRKFMSDNWEKYLATLKKLTNV
jgi:hypothetical protein